MWQGTTLDLIPGVQVDNRLGIRIAIEHLAGLGHRRIAFIGGRPLGDIQERQAAYADAAVELLGGVRAGYIQHVANTPDGGEAALAALLETTPRPTAIVASTDVLAIGVLRAALLRRISVPDELSVVGFDDIAMARVTVPSLTTIRMPMDAMAAEAIDLLVGRSGAADDREGRRTDASVVRVFPPALVERASTATAPSAERPPMPTARTASGA
jgi:DNA-binding LacI/PurR family transcriptional regulator